MKPPKPQLIIQSFSQIIAIHQINNKFSIFSSFMNIHEITNRIIIINQIITSTNRDHGPNQQSKDEQKSNLY